MAFPRFSASQVHSELDMLEYKGGSHPLAHPIEQHSKLYHPRDASHLKLEELFGIKPEVDYFETAHGHHLRNAVFEPRRSCKATVTISPGKGETLRVYRRLGTALARRGYRTFVLEPCGQGGSTRLIANPQKVHDPSEFLPHRSNLADFIHMHQRLRPNDQKPSILVGHSMGGGFPIPGLACEQFAVDAFLALAPLIETPRAPLTGRESLKCRAYIRLMMSLGAGEQYVSKGHDYIDESITDKNPYTDYFPALEDAKKDWQQGSSLVTSDPTVAWLRSYYKNGDRIMALPAGSIKIPTHIVLASRDTIVCNARTREAAKAFSDCKITEVNAKHALALGGPEIIDYIVHSVEELCRIVTARRKSAPRGALLN